ncbi:MAG: RNA polymerase sigma factor [Pseudomonadota bacterium]
MQNSRRNQLNTLVAPHLNTLFRMAYQLLRNSADAQDLVQDTCVAACANLDALAAADSPLRWLLRVQQNRFIDMHRRRVRSPLVAADEDTAAAVVSDLPDPEQLLQQLQSETLLERAFLQLESMQRVLLTLRAEGYELPEIEEITGIEREALGARLRRARLRLAQVLADMNREAAVVRHIGSGR